MLPNGKYYYENLDAKSALEIIKNDPSEILNFLAKDQTEELQMAAVTKKHELIWAISTPTLKVKEYVLSKFPNEIENISTANIDEEDWQIAIMSDVDVLRKWWTVYEKDPSKQPTFGTWYTWVTYLSKTQTKTLRFLKSQKITNVIPLWVQFSLVFFVNDSAKRFLPNYETINNIPTAILAKMITDAKSGKINEKAFTALMLLYKD